jgi:hypothetical protein
VGDELIVECHSGYTYAERPSAITSAGKRYIITNIIRQDKTPLGRMFYVLTADGREWRLLYNEESDRWQNLD